jgi:hypothetical protein
VNRRTGWRIIRRRHWLDYDPVALAVLVIGIGMIELVRIDHLTLLISTAKSGHEYPDRGLCHVAIQFTGAECVL